MIRGGKVSRYIIHAHTACTDGTGRLRDFTEVVKVKSNQSKVSSSSCSGSAFPGSVSGSGFWLLSRLLARVSPILHYPGTETGSHSPVDDGHEVDDPEAGPEHEVARGQDVEEDEEAGGHPPLTVSCPRCLRL